jgi:hypothetical protein
MNGVAETTAGTGRGRRLAVTALLVVGTLLMIGAGLGIWAERQALDTDEWVDTSGQLLENEQIRTTVGVHLVERVYDSDAVQQRLTEALPPALDRLAAPAAAGLQELARRDAPRVLGSAAALSAWREANRAAHETLLRVVDGEGGGVSLDLRGLVEQVASRTGLPPEAADRLPSDVAQLEVLPPDELKTARTLIDAFRALGWVLFGLAVAAFAGAVALSKDRRRTTLSVGVCFLIAGIALLAVRRLTGRVVVDALAEAPNAQSAAGEAWSIATSLMVDVTQGGMLLGLILVAGAWLYGPGRRATALRRLSAPAVSRDPAVARTGLAVLLLLLVLWGPVPWTERVVPVLLLTVAAFAWLEAIRRMQLPLPKEET